MKIPPPSVASPVRLDRVRRALLASQRPLGEHDYSGTTVANPVGVTLGVT